MERNTTMGTEDLFDFGFTAVDETELNAYQEAEKLKAEADSKLSAADSSTAKLQGKVDKLYNAIQPLLNNLKANPEKEYIYWPKRMNKIEAFESHLQGIYSE
jgi:hypothetical protein